MVFWSSIVFYNSYLPDIALPHQYDTISARGFIMGYIGGVVFTHFQFSYGDVSYFFWYPR
ncbi:hypothetical protein CCAN2_1710011 [Capnocytophaga canimorsus]|nr:hypothetical protein CCAN2_1710011 [Capnocytophaga canimorsus]